MYDVTWGVRGNATVGLCSAGAEEVQRIRGSHWLDVSKVYSDPYWTGQLSKLQVCGSLTGGKRTELRLLYCLDADD